MRYLLIISFFNCFPAMCQYVDNKIDLEVSTTVESPIGPKDQKGLSTLHSNMGLGYGYNVGATYLISSKLGVGIKYANRRFINHQHQDQLPLLDNPQSDFHEYLIQLNYLIGKKHQVGFNLSAGLVNHQINVDQLIVIADEPFENVPSKFRETEFTTEAGAVGIIELSHDLKIIARLSYRFMTADNPLYVDENFQGIGVTVGMIKKLFKNKTFQYD